ncbi:MEDS domain-containing protein [Ectothiorhodospiraceae bacterium 2226]|nr:MEDS domain-containing protein [Ectothiorhodospiraceae bacterium 2226]
MHVSRKISGKVPSGLPALQDVAWGTHVCHFYRSEAELREPLVAFFRVGLAQGDKCLWVCGQPLEVDQARAALAEVVPDLAERERSGQIRLLDHARWYGEIAAGSKVLQAWLDLEEEALSEGYRGLRITGNVFWLERGDWASFAEYEAAVHEAFHSRRILALCSYPLDRCSADDVLEVLQNHECALVSRGGRWEPVHTATQLLAAVNQREASSPPRPDHEVHFFREAAYPADCIAAFLAGTAPGARAVLVPPCRLAPLRDALHARGVDPASVQFIDAEQLLAELGWPEAVDVARLRPALEALVKRLQGSGHQARLYGEVVDVLVRGGRTPSALELEDIWNHLQRRYDFALWCGYEQAAFERGDTRAYASVCAAHGELHAVAATDDKLLSRAYLAEVRERQAHEDERRRLLRLERDASTRLALLQHITSELSSAASVFDIGVVICNTLRERVGATAVLMVAPYGEELRTVKYDGLAPAVAERFVTGPLHAPLPVTDAFHASEAVWLHNAAQIKAHYPGLPTESRAIAALPLMVGGRTLAAIAMGFATPQDFDAAQRALLEDIAVQAALAVERAQLYEEAARERQRAEHAAQAKDRFLAMLGHELRNPLAALSSAAEVLVRTGLRPDVVARTQSALQRQVAHMTRLVDDLLDVQRIVAGKVFLEVATVDLRDLLTEILQDRRAPVQARELQLVASLPDESVWVTGDRVRLAQVFDNLLTNAIKFTDPGGTLTVAMDRAQDEVTVTVRDTGAGIEAELLPHVFSPFRQVRQGLARTAGGLGLGLALVKGLVELHRGSVTAASPGPGAGSEFVVRLPLTQPGQVAAPQTPRSHEAVQVLVVEDNPDAAEMLAEMLRLGGHEVNLCDNGEDAMRRLRQEPPQLLLCDIGLPGALNGYDIARAVRGDPRLGGMFLVALTGYGGPGDVAEALDAGFDMHLTKPMRAEAVEEVLSRMQARQSRAS